MAVVTSSLSRFSPVTRAWFDGAFDVSLDGQLVHSMYRDGGFPEPAAVLEAVRARLEATAPEAAPSA